MKRIAMFLAAAMAAFGAWADTWTDPDTGYTWTYRINGNTAEIYGNWCPSPAISPKPTGAVTIPSTLGGKPVTSIGGWAFEECSGLTSVTIPNSVTSIGDYAFYNCSGLTSVTIPDSVTSIGNYAFYDCGGLTSVTIPDSVTSIGSSAFSGCSGLTSVTIPDSVTSIGDAAFRGCSGLTSVTIPNSVTSIGASAFYNCSGLTSVHITDLAKWCGISFYDNPLTYAHNLYINGVKVTDLTIPDSVANISNYAFSGCSGITSVIIPDSVTSIGASAFAYCSGLTSVTMPDSVTSIGQDAFSGCSEDLYDTTTIPGVKIVDNWVVGYTDALSGDLDLMGIRGIGNSAFSGCSGLTSVKIPDGVTSIGYSAFSGCSRLTSVSIPDSVTSIGSSAFRGCSGLTSVTIPDSVTSIGQYAFDGCSGLTSVTIPDSVTSIGGSAFSGCSRLTSVTIPDSVTSIGYDAFYNCNGLTSVHITDLAKWCGISFYDNPLNYAHNLYINGVKVTDLVIPDSVANISNYAFPGCSGITSVTIPNSITNIGNSAFRGCSGLTSVTIPDSVTSIGSGAFSNCRGLTSVTIPDSVTSIGEYAFSGCGDSLFDTTSIPGVKLVDGWAVGHTDSLSGNLDLTGVRGVGPYAFESCSGLTSVTIPDGFTSIGNGVFWECSSLTSVTIPDSVTSIGEWAFYNCSGLTSVTIPDSVMSIGENAFSGCSGLVDVTVPQYVCTNCMSSVFPSSYQLIMNVVILDGVTNINANAFSGCCSLASVTIPDSVTSIGPDAFAYCSNLVRVNISDLSAWVDIAFGNDMSNPLYYGNLNLTLSGELVFPVGTTSIRAYALRGCENLTSVTIPDGVTSIGAAAFSGCSGLTEIVIPNSVTNVGENAFAGCSGLVRITIPAGFVSSSFVEAFSLPDIKEIVFLDGRTVIPDNYFAGCVALETMDIPESVVRIGTDVFEACSALETVVTNGLVLYQGWCLGLADATLCPSYLAIPEGVRGIAAGAFAGKYEIEEVEFPSTLRFVGARAFRDCTGIEEIVLPEGVVAVDREAFRNCTYAHALSLPGTLREIGDGAFGNCALLMSVEIPDGVAEVGEVAFSNCWRMLSASIPCSVTNIGEGAFVECRRLTGVTVPLGLVSLAELFPSAYGKIESMVVNSDARECVPPMVPGLFAGCGAMANLTLPKDLAEVSADAFAGCTNMAAFNLPNTVTNIGARAFKDLRQLSAFVFPTGLVAIGESAFSGCSGISALALPEGLERIGENAFYGLSLLARVDIPCAVEVIGADAFGMCDRVRAISLPGDVATVRNIFPNTYSQIASAVVVGRHIESAAPYQMMDGLFEGCSALVSVEMPPSLTVIGARAFKGCSSLTAAGIPSGVTSLGEEVFMGCGNLSQMALPTGLAVLPACAFANCSSMTELTVPESVSELGANVFTGCSLLRSIRFVGNAPAYDAAAYGGTDASLVTYVPNGSMGWDGVPTSRALPEFWPDWTTHDIKWWEPNRFLVTFDPNDGVGGVATQVVQVTGTTYVLPTDPARMGTTFAGWWTEAVGGARVTAVTQVALTRPHTFYAHWTYNRYSVVFDANGGDGEMAAQELTVSTGAVLPECGFTRIGYAFMGWATEPGGAFVYANAAEVLNLSYEQGASVTLYAVWEERDWTLADYVDCGNLVFSNDVAAAWEPDETTFKIGGVSLRSGAIGAAAEGGRTNTTLTATVVGEGSGSFWWKVSCEEMDADYDEWYDYAVFTIDGVEIAKIAGDSGWRQVEYTVTGAGEHVLEWTFTRDDYDEDETAYENAAWVDGVVWTPKPVTVTFADGGATVGTVPEAVTKYEGYELTLPGAGTLANGAYVFMGWSDGETTYASGAVYVFGSAYTTLTAVWGEKVWTLGEAVDADILSFTTGGYADWSVDGSTGWTNGVSAKSGTVTNGLSSWIETTVSGAGTLVFRWNVMGGVHRNNPFAYAKVEVDGVQQAQEHKTEGWKEQTVEIAVAGAHTIRWTYLRTSPRDADGDCAWLDAVSWTPGSMAPDPIPPVASDDDVAAALTGTADANVAANVANAAQYAAYRTWALSVTNGTTTAQMIKESDKAWLSFAFGANALIGKEITSNDVRIVAFEAVDVDSGAMGSSRPTFAFEVAIDNVNIGGGMVAVETLKENLKKVLGIEGAARLEESAFSSENVDFEIGTPKDGKATFTAKPRDSAKGDGGAFFMRVRVKQ